MSDEQVQKCDLCTWMNGLSNFPQWLYLTFAFKGLVPRDALLIRADIAV